MKSSVSYTTARTLRGFTSWFSRIRTSALSDEEHVPFVVSACGYHAPPARQAADEGGERWLPGLSLENFS
ncbi:hypothetical protein [Hyphomicrobium sp.]|uniref:hypothetical protein n=1 Tax=Hyphomicrobium sp. TaxID=82 RepID=UPI000FB0F97F|nr:hypothetical protein [Hyphomicrobium sp.]RUO98891.1 MAG: hypothetical protein EKK30_09420 [Hyphomicrobium sp.]